MRRRATRAWMGGALGTWLYFGSIGVAGAVDLQAALGAAEGRDPTLAAARANRDAAAENAPIAKARLLPQVSLRGTVSRINQQSSQDTILGTRSDEFTGPADNVQLALRQALYRPRDQIGVTIGELQAAIGEHKLSSAWSDVWLRTVRLWLEVLAADAQREAFVDAVAAAQRIQAQARMRLESGDGTRDAVAEADAQFGAARARLLEAELLLASRQRNFALQTGLPALDLERWRLPDDRLPALAARDPLDFADRVVARNAELNAAIATLSIEEARLAQARADYRPAVDLFLSGTYSRNDTASNVGATYRIGQLGVQFSVPLYTGGGLTAAERQAVAASVASAAERDAYIQQLRQRVALDWAAQEGLLARVAGTLELIVAAREQLRAAELGLRHGLRSVGDVGDAAALLAARRRDLAELRLAVLTTQAQLLALLPVDDPLWQGWISELQARARRS